jgi:hypothetical protein
MFGDMDERDFPFTHTAVLRRWRAELVTEFVGWMIHRDPPRDEKAAGLATVLISQTGRACT